MSSFKAEFTEEEHVKVDFLFENKTIDMEAQMKDIFMFSVNIEKLKAILMMLIEKHKKTQVELRDLSKKTEVIDELVEQGQDFRRKFGDHSHQLLKHEDQLFSLTNMVNGYKDQFQKMNFSIDFLMKEKDSHHKRIERLEAEINGIRDSNINLTTQIQFIKDHYLMKRTYEEQRTQMKEDIKKSFQDVEDQIRKLNAKCMDVEKDMYNITDKLKEKINDNFNSQGSQIQSLVSKTNKFEDDIESILKQLKELKNKVDDKLDKSKFKKSHKKLKGRLSKLEKFIELIEDKIKYLLNAKEFSFLKDLEQKFPQIEQWVNDLRGLVAGLSGFGDLTEMVKELQQKKAEKEKVNGMEKKQQDMSKQIDDILAALLQIHKSLEAKGTPVQTTTIQHVDNSDLINQLRNEIDQLRRQMKDFEIQLKMKGDGKGVNPADLERMIKQIVNALIGDLASKIDELWPLKAKVKKLQHAVKHLKALLLEALAYLRDGKDDPMFSKKPLMGISCASCDKDVYNMIGRPADFSAWQKFPSRDLTDKIAKGNMRITRIRNGRPESAATKTQQRLLQAQNFGNNQFAEQQYESDNGFIVADDDNWSPEQMKFRTKGGPQSIAVSSKNLYNVVTQNAGEELGSLRQKYAEDTSGTKFSQNEVGSTNFYLNKKPQTVASLSHLTDQPKIKGVNDHGMSGGEGSEIFNMSSGSKTTNKLAAIKSKGQIKKTS